MACRGGFRTRVFLGQEEGQKGRGVRRVETVPADGTGLTVLLSSEQGLIEVSTFLQSLVTIITACIKEKLEKIRDHERKEETFTPMPSLYYMELTKLLLNHASDNIPKADEIRTLIKDVWDTRTAKLRVSADSFVRQQEAHAKLDNLTLMEINTSGAFLTQALNHMYKLRTNLQPSDSAQSQDL
uniref:GINS complex subunit 2 n=1 Tax=Balaenoptera musculus TaxID=9771 RepID=A0A8C0DRU0_BALMU